MIGSGPPRPGARRSAPNAAPFPLVRRSGRVRPFPCLGVGPTTHGVLIEHPFPVVLLDESGSVSVLAVRSAQGRPT